MSAACGVTTSTNNNSNTSANISTIKINIIIWAVSDQRLHISVRKKIAQKQLAHPHLRSCLFYANSPEKVSAAHICLYWQLFFIHFNLNFQFTHSQPAFCTFFFKFFPHIKIFVFHFPFPTSFILFCPTEIAVMAKLYCGDKFICAFCLKIPTTTHRHTHISLCGYFEMRFFTCPATLFACFTPQLALTRSFSAVFRCFSIL